MPWSQALPGFLITAPPSVLVPAVRGALAVWIENQQKNKKNGLERQNSWKYGISKNKSVRDRKSEGAVPVLFRDKD